MKKLLFSLFICSGSFITAQESSSWNGMFTGTLVGVESTLQGQCTGANWNGVVDAGGYLFNLKGAIEGMNVKGTMSDPQAGAELPFRASLSGNQLSIFIRDVNPLSGVEEDMELVFTRSANQKPNVSSSKPVSGNTNIDPKLVGNWRYTDSYVSGQFSFATDYFMRFNQDGTMLWTDGRTAGGGPDISMDSGTGDVHEAHWKIDSKVIWLNGGNGWEYYATYYAEDQRMMLTFKNGNKQVWERL